MIAALLQLQLNTYKVLDSFAAYLSRLTVILPDGTEAPVKPHTVVNRVYAVVSLFRYHDIQVANDSFKQKVTLPKVTEIDDKPAKAEQIRL